jgi:acyl-CoA thioesterase-2
MDIREYVGLRPTGDPREWAMAWTPHVLTGAGALHGGAGLALAVEAAQATVGRPVVAATAQYLGFVKPPSPVRIRVGIDVAGHQLTQAQSTVSVGDREILRASVTLGARTSPIRQTWRRMPEVAPPDRCPRLQPLLSRPGTLSDVCEFRLASGRPKQAWDGTRGSGRSALWCRLPGGGRHLSAGDIALFSDFPLQPLSDAIGTATTGTSLDNSVRIVALARTEWVLSEAEVEAVAGGLGHVVTRLWAQDGTLLAVAAQTLALRGTPAVDRETGALAPRRRRMVSE